jgi:hypothetical protein
LAGHQTATNAQPAALVDGHPADAGGAKTKTGSF